MAHVGDEVAAHLLDAALAGAVLDQGEHQPRAQRRDPGDDRARRGAVAGQLHLGLADLAVAPDHVDQVPQLLDEDLVAAHQPEGVRRRGGLEHAVLGVHDHRGRRSTDRTAATPGGTTGSSVGRAPVLQPVADVPGEYGAPGDDRPDDGSQRCLGRRVHAPIVRIATTDDPPRTPVRQPCAHCSPRVHRRPPAGHLGPPRLRPMREAFHDQLDAIFTDLADDLRPGGDGRTPRHRGAADRRRRRSPSR